MNQKQVFAYLNIAILMFNDNLFKIHNCYSDKVLEISK